MLNLELSYELVLFWLNIYTSSSGFGLNRYYRSLWFSYSYALEECGERKSAEKLARRALAINKQSPFAIHAMGMYLIFIGYKIQIPGLYL